MEWIDKTAAARFLTGSRICPQPSRAGPAARPRSPARWPSVIGWAVLGPIFRFSNTWQLVINTGTTIVTFLMVFLIQRTQNKDALAIHLKLNEIVAALDGASNRLIEVEALSEEDLETLECYYGELAELARKEDDLAHSHSVEEARQRHSTKQRPRRRAG
jgi:low affinity Fe/Cu permease